MLKDEIEQILELEKKYSDIANRIFAMKDEIDNLSKQRYQIANQYVMKQDQVGRIITPLKPQNIFFEKDGITDTVFTDAKGRAQVKKMITLDEAEQELMIRKLQ